MQTVGHNEIYKGVSTNLYVDDVITDAGKATRREVVERPNAVVVLALENDGEFWVVRQDRYPTKQYLWELPAGKIEGSEDPINCAKRELAEEIGKKAMIWTPLGSWYQSPGYSTELMYGFVATGLEDTEQPEADDTGEIEKKLITSSVAFFTVYDAKSLVTLFLAGKLGYGCI